MAQDGKITNKELLENDLLKPLHDGLDIADLKAVAFLKTLQTIATVSKEITNTAPLKSSKDITDQQKAIKEGQDAAKAYQEFVKTAAAQQKKENAEAEAAVKSKATAEKKAAADSDKNAKQKDAADKVELKNADAKAKALEKEAAKVALANTAYEKLKKQYKDAADLAKNLQSQIVLNGNATEVQQAKADKASKDALRIQKQLLDVEKGVGDARRNVGFYPQVEKSVLGFLGKLPGGKEAAEGIEKLKGMAEGFHKSGESAAEAAKKLGLFSGVAGEIGGVGAGAVVGIGGAAAAAVTLMGTAFFRTAEGAAVMNTAFESVKGGFIGLLAAINPFGDAFGHFYDSTVSGIKAGYDLAKLENNEIRILAELTKQQQVYNEQKIKQGIILNDVTQSYTRQQSAVQVLTENQLKSNEAAIAAADLELKIINAKIAEKKGVGSPGSDEEKKFGELVLKRAETEKEINDLRAEGLAVAREGELKLLELKIQQKEAILGLELAEINGEAAFYALRKNNDALNFETRKAYNEKEIEAQLKANTLQLEDAREILELIQKQKDQAAEKDRENNDKLSADRIATFNKETAKLLGIKREQEQALKDKLFGGIPATAEQQKDVLQGLRDAGQIVREADALDATNNRLKLLQSQRILQIDTDIAEAKNTVVGKSKEELAVETKIAQLEAQRKIQIEQNLESRQNLAITEFQLLLRLADKTKAFQEERFNRELEGDKKSFKFKEELEERRRKSNDEYLQSAQAAADKAFKDVKQIKTDPATGKESLVPIQIDFKALTELPIEKISAAVAESISKLRLAGVVEGVPINFLKSLETSAKNSAENVRNLTKELEDLTKQLEDLKAKNIVGFDLVHNEGDPDLVEHRIALEKKQADAIADIKFAAETKALKDKYDADYKVASEIKENGEGNFKLTKEQLEKLEQLRKDYDVAGFELDFERDNQKRLNEIKRLRDTATRQEKIDDIAESARELEIQKTTKNLKRREKLITADKEQRLKAQIASDYELLAQLEKNKDDTVDIEKKIQDEKEKLFELTEKKRKKRDDDILKSAIQITSLVGQELQRRADLENKILSDQIAAREKNIDQETALAAAGKSNQLAFEKSQLAKEQLVQKEALERQAKQQEAVKLAEAFLNLLNTHLQNGENYGEAALRAFGEVGLAKGIADALSHYDGTEDTGPGGNIDSRGGMLSILHPHEGVVNRKANEANPGAVKALNDGTFLTDFIPKFLPEYAMAMPVLAGNSFAENIGNSLLVAEIKVLKTEHGKLLKQIADKPEHGFDADRFGNIIETRIARGLTIRETKYRQPKPL